MKKLLQYLLSIACVLSAAFPAIAAEPQYPARPVRMIVPFAPGGRTGSRRGGWCWGGDGARLPGCLRWVWLMLRSAAVIFSTSVFIAPAVAQEYPSRPVRMIVPFAPGGPTDTIARVLAAKLTETFGQQVVVDNRAGAGGNIGMGLAANASADGYTILVVSSSFVVNPGLYKNIPYDPYKSFIAISNVAASPNVFVVHPSLPSKTLKDLVTLMKNDPKKFSIATPGIGTTPDLSAQLLRLTAKADIATVPYGGAGPAVAAVVGGQVPVGCTALPPTTPYITSGRLHALAVTGAKRSQALPNVPTMAEAGFPGQEADTLQGILVPAGTPKAVVDRIHADLTKIMAQPDVKKRVSDLGFDVIASSPKEFSAQIKSEVAKWSKVIKSAGIQVN